MWRLGHSLGCVDCTLAWGRVEQGMMGKHVLFGQRRAGWILLVDWMQDGGQDGGMRQWECMPLGGRNQLSLVLAFLPCPTQPPPGPHLLPLRCLAEFVYKLAHRHQHGQDQAGSQDDEDAADLLDAQSTGLLVLLFGAPAAPPPLLLHDVQLVLLLQLQNGDGDFVPVGGACGGRGGCQWGLFT